MISNLHFSPADFDPFVGHLAVLAAVFDLKIVANFVHLEQMFLLGFVFRRFSDLLASELPLPRPDFLPLEVVVPIVH